MDQAFQKEKNQFINRYRGLLRAAKDFISKEDQKRIRTAFNLVTSLNTDIRRESGEPHAFHLINVARICIDEIGLGATSIIAALLHETVERNQLKISEVERRFGHHVAIIVDGLTKVSNLEPKDPKTQAENFRQLLLTLSSDARVILIKLAERLEIMRSLSYLDKELQLKYASEAFYLYAPLAHRLGIYRLKSELEDLAMKFTNSEEYKSIIKKMKDTTSKRNKFIREFIEPIEVELKARAFLFEIKGRTKSTFSIFKKMQKQGVDFEEVYDLFAIRIILDSLPENEKSDCWQVYSIITDKYPPNPERLRDWISIPKNNGYESLHTTVMGPEGKWVEVQIRTARMNEIAEMGFAAHWKYKGLKEEQGIDQWLTRLRGILESPEPTPEDFAEQFRMDLYSNEMYIFTPKGDLRKLRTGATVLDFAFDIHSDIGCQCIGARIGGRNVPIKHILHNGDVVEIITSKNQKPKKDWLNFVVTSKAKAKIKQQLRDDENREMLLGKELLYRRFKNWKVENPEEAIRLLIKQLKIRKPSDLFIQVAEDKLDIAGLKAILIEPDKPLQSSFESKPEVEQLDDDHRAPSKGDDYLVIDEKLVNVEYKLAKCCNPIFGDSIFGFVTISEGIKIHRTGCPNAHQLQSRWGYRIVKAKWKETRTAGSFQTTIKITGIDELGILNRISEVISKDLKVNIRNISINSSNGLFEGKIQISIESTKHLEMLLYKLGRIHGIQKAIRIK